ncbi:MULTISPECIES: DinB family protein [Flavobacterium]|uniref:DinB family protein n=1 Tax=Flavobacterium TaxID=237 RepID=UPI00118411BE|nr:MULTISPECIES: DinB family protein [Flavobacterium]MCR4030580.1 DinB family protein [Flavobacterium panacis]
MKSTSEIANRFREVILNGTWIANTNFKDQLENLDWKIAVSPVQNLNTIAALAQHIHYYIDGINTVFKGGNLDIKDKFSFDFPPVQSQEEWNIFLTQFWNAAEEFASLVEQIPDKKLDESFVDIKYGSYKRNIEAMIEHSYYHLGQIVLIKKLLTN